MSVRPQLTTWESRPDCELAVLSSALVRVRVRVRVRVS
jgi:hypothetical protein